MEIKWSSVMLTSQRNRRAWAVLACPRCAGVVALDLALSGGMAIQAGASLASGYTVNEIGSIPAAGGAGTGVAHLPADVEKYFGDALRVVDAGVFDAGAVQLRKTLEAAAAHRGVTGRNLMQSIEALIADGHITRDFGGVLHHVRKVGNVGAHAGDEQLDQQEIERAVRFTRQVLRNLFEVPGELAELGGGAVGPE